MNRRENRPTECTSLHPASEPTVIILLHVSRSVHLVASLCVLQAAKERSRTAAQTSTPLCAEHIM